MREFEFWFGFAHGLCIGCVVALLIAKLIGGC